MIPRDSDFRPPNAPFVLHSLSVAGSSAENSSSEIPLTVNYVPSKFSGPRRRKTTKIRVMGFPRGGGVKAFSSGQTRIPNSADDDVDGLDVSKWFRKGAARRWNVFKTVLFLSNVAFFISTLAALLFCLLTWFDVFQDADVIRVGNRTELVFSTLAAAFGLLTSLIGLNGVLLNNRGFLALYTFFLWITFAFLVIPGYITYKKREFNLEGKLNSQWSRNLGTSGRLRIQNKLGCCGWFSPFVEATISQSCYARSILPGCKLSYMNWQRRILKRWYTIIFSLVPAQIGAILAGLLCSNHVTYRFGKGMIPKRYQLNPTAMKVIIDNYTNQIAEQYGTDVASNVIAKSGVLSLANQEGAPLLSANTLPFGSLRESKGN